MTLLRYLLFRSGINYSTTARWILKSGLGRRAKQAGRARREELQRRIFLSLDDVDWSRTKVYSMGNFGQLYVNVTGREPRGSVSRGAEYEQVLSDLARRLQAMTDPETGQPVIERILRRDEVYDGPYAGQAPDLLFFTQDMNYKAMGLSDFSSPHVFDPVYGTTGHHRMKGVMIWHGPGVFRQGEQYDKARIQDLAPTLLYTIGLPILKEMDGQVLLDIFTPEFRQQHDVTYTEAEAESHHEGDSAYSDQEESELRDTLRALGYVT
jgi:predicted AlkP superfamily phosphohydrolase/phosphomutase